MSHPAEHVNPEEFVECFRDNSSKRLIIHDDGDPNPVAISGTETPRERNLALEMIFRDGHLQHLHDGLRTLDMA